MSQLPRAPDRGLSFGLLGPLAVWLNGRTVDAGPPQQQELLALLLLQRNQRISTDAIADAVWGEKVPATALQTIRTYISRLRRIMGGDGEVALASDTGGYRLSIATDRIDRDRFLVLAAAGRTSLLAGDPRPAEDQLRAALALFRGPPLAGLHRVEFAHEEAGRLAELRLLAEEDLIDAMLAQGGHRDALPRLRELGADEPYRERFAAQLMLALYRSGQQVEALSVYRGVRERLRDELGIEPGRELQDLERMILLQERTLDHDAVGRLHGVPRYGGAFLGRRDATAEVQRMFRRGRIVTVVGPAGVGKTRLAAEVADQLRRRFPGGVWWIGLEAARGPEVIWAIRRRLGIRDSVLGSLGNLTVARLQGERALLVLDNCEHVASEVSAFATELLASTTDVRVLATSREPLRIGPEQVHRLAPFDVPGASLSSRKLLESAAVRLIISRAKAAGATRTFGPAEGPALRTVIEHLDGLPLAIELAAAKLAALSPGELARSLRGNLALLTGGARTAPARHQTLEAAIAWSYDLLHNNEQRVLRHLSAFSGSFDIAAARAVAGEDQEAGDGELLPIVARLVQKSLVAAEHGEVTRYRLLAVVRTFAQERAIGNREMDAAAERHREYYTAVAERIATHMLDGSLGEWLRVGSLEHDNLHGALRRALTEGDGESALQLASALAPFWFRIGHLREGRALLDQALALAAPTSAWLPRGLLGRAWLADAEGAVDAVDAARSALDVAEPGSELRAFALAQLASHDIRAGELALAAGKLREAQTIFERLGHAEGVALVEQLTGSAALRDGNVDRAIGHLTASRDRYRELRAGIDAGWTLVLLARAALIKSDLALAYSAASDAVRDFRMRGDQRGVVASLACLGRVHIASGDREHAETLLGEALRLSQTHGYDAEGSDARRALESLGHPRSVDV